MTQRSKPPTGETEEEVIDLRSSGLLWLINTTVFHPRGFALGMSPDGLFTLMGDGSERWAFSEDVDWPEGEGPDDRFRAAEALFASRRIHADEEVG
jgi:hypothetical protein